MVLKALNTRWAMMQRFVSVVQDLHDDLVVEMEPLTKWEYEQMMSSDADVRAR